MSVNIAFQRYAISPKLQNIIGGEREIAGVVSVQGRFCSRDGEMADYMSKKGRFCSRDGQPGVAAAEKKCKYPGGSHFFRSRWAKYV